MTNLFFLAAALAATQSEDTRAPRALLDGQLLYTMCRQGDAGAKVPEAFCAGYIIGAIDSIEADRALADKNSCLPKGVQSETLRDLAVKFLESNPSLRDVGAAANVLLALIDAYPSCR